MTEDPSSVASSLSVAELISSRRENLWKNELRNPLHAVDAICAAREKAFERFAENPVSLHALKLSAENKSKKPEPTKDAGTRNPAQKSPKKNHPLPQNPLLTLNELQGKLLELLRSYEVQTCSSFSETDGDLLTAVGVTIRACSSELAELQKLCFKRPIPLLVLQRIVRVHRTVNNIFQRLIHWKLPESGDAGVSKIAQSLLDTICVLCGVVAKASGMVKSAEHIATFHFDILDWILSNGGEFLNPKPTQKVRKQIQFEESSVEEEREIVAKIKETLPEIKSFSIKNCGETSYLRSETTSFRDEYPDYWRTIEESASDWISGVAQEANRMLAETEDMFIREVLKREFFGS
ncbi:unnamed protein product [Notodromas monacha]|uniref:Uncharacterized protein n=1 Tax=Notodromas monacha TaxID=399045 RepID=A0A7R9GEU3_9CRUS|nr:unnamed protein product [Notodromas monacha]CAG0920110.1 unnamed protein product [Notodromas monacha]